MKHLCFFVCSFFIIFCSSAQKTSTLTIGEISQAKGSAQGYVLFTPINSKNTYLIDKCGNPVHTWTSKYNPAQSVYLLADGSLLRPAYDSIKQGGLAVVGGRIERFDWNNNLLWSYAISNETQRQHHDIYPMPNGNVLAIVAKKRLKEESAAVGRKPFDDQDSFILDEQILEIKPIGRDSGIVVWSWDTWDHLVQDEYPDKPNYGVVAQNPQLINLNYAPTSGHDWLHFNGLSYNPALDQIVVSIHEFSEIFIIDHSTTTAQSASHKGGKRGKGGDLLYRWGNPQAYKTGKASDQKLFRQHNPYWIPKGMKDGGKIMVFNNGQGRAGKFYSSVDVIDPPMDQNGNYIMPPGKMAMPSTFVWSYNAADTTCFFSKNISGAQRLANGNTLICSGHNGKLFEIDANKNMVWSYIVHSGVQANVEGADSNPQTFRCTFYDFTYSAFKGRKLSACPPMEIPRFFPCFAK